MEKIKTFLKSEQFKELVKYVVFGVLTTVVSILSFKLFDYILGEKYYLITNVISWIFAVAFAFATNKIWVFNSKSWSARVLIKELSSFIVARLLSLGIEEGGLWILISLLNMGDMQPFKIFSFSVNGNLLAKVIMQIVVVILNYVFSKFIIFKKKRGAEDEA